MQRCFIGFSISHNATLALTDAQRSIAHTLDPNASPRLVAPHNFHLTLKFLGPTSDAQYDALLQHLPASVQAWQRSEVAITGIGAFPDVTRPSTIFADVPEQKGRNEVLGLCDLLESKCSELGFAAATRPDAPHITLMRISRPHQYDWRGFELAAHRWQHIHFGYVDTSAVILYASQQKGDVLRYVPLQHFSCHN